MPDDPNTEGPRETVAETTSPSPADREHERFGPYRILEKSGEGGMGTVYLAEQTRPVHRRVALKVIKRGMDSKRVIARFEAERQALALMAHPSIATIYDAGMTPDGRPYFAMEYVEGVPITEHCDRHRSSIAERLDLFVQVCEGVQHAHQKAVIHRDLKPSNVLVSVHGSRPTVKIIDFGLAKALAHTLTDRTLHTELGMIVGTLEYMSPEQAEMTAQDVDTRSDVYSLGVMLYELLVGALPFDVMELRRAGLDEIRRCIREEEPPRPSARLSSLGDRSTESAQSRRTEPAALRRLLRGDLDWITMRALEKDRARRYASPADLAEDVRRYLRHEPVLAHAPTAAYRTAKFVRRHRLGVAAAAVMSFGLAAGTVGSTTGLVRARRAEAEARREKAAAEQEARVKGQVADFLKNVFRVSHATVAKGNSVTARELLDQAAGRIDTDLADQPEMQAEMEAIMSSVYLSLGLLDEAERLSTKALNTCKRALGPDDRKTMQAASQLASVLNDQGRLDDARELHARVLEQQERVLGREDQDTIATMYELANDYMRQRRPAEAESLYRAALEWRERKLGPEDPAMFGPMLGLAQTCQLQGRFAEAEKQYSRLIELARRVLGPDHLNTLTYMSNLANLYIYQERYDEAERLQGEVLAARQRVLGPDHPYTRESMYNIACLWARKGDRARGLDWLRRALEGKGNPAFVPEQDPDLDDLHGAEFDSLVGAFRRRLADPSVAAGNPPKG